MNIIETGIEGLLVIELRIFEDDRGLFFESYNQKQFEEAGIQTNFVQDNHSQSKAGVLRGLHYQLPPHGLVKLVRCTRGRILDVAVDVRKESPTYLKWFSLELSADNKKQLYIPEGFLHGFYTIEDADVQYKVSDFYYPELDGSIRFDDEQISVDWGYDDKPVLSDKDTAAPNLKDANLPF